MKLFLAVCAVLAIEDIFVHSVFAIGHTVTVFRGGHRISLALTVADAILVGAISAGVFAIAERARRDATAIATIERKVFVATACPARPATIDAFFIAVFGPVIAAVLIFIKANTIIATGVQLFAADMIVAGGVSRTGCLENRAQRRGSHACAIQDTRVHVVFKAVLRGSIPSEELSALWGKGLETKGGRQSGLTEGTCTYAAIRIQKDFFALFIAGEALHVSMDGCWENVS